MPAYIVAQVTIAAGASLSGEVNLGGLRVGQIHGSAEWTAASLAVDGASAPGGTFYPVYDLSEDENGVITDALLEIAISAGRVVSLTEKAAAIVPLGVVKFRSVQVGNPSVAVNQAAERILWVVGTA